MGIELEPGSYAIPESEIDKFNSLILEIFVRQL